MARRIESIFYYITLSTIVMLILYVFIELLRKGRLGVDQDALGF